MKVLLVLVAFAAITYAQTAAELGLDPLDDMPATEAEIFATRGPHGVEELPGFEDAEESEREDLDSELEDVEDAEAPSALTNFERFDVEEARTAGLLADLSYCSLQELRMNNCAGCKALGKEFEIVYVHHGLGDTLMYVARFKKPFWSSSPGTVVVGFRGTQKLQFLNWKLNLAAQKVPSFFKGVPGRQHKGFLISFWVQVLLLRDGDAHSRGRYDRMMMMLRKAGRIIVTGHSLGGATAMNMVAHLFSEREFNNRDIWLYTFGAPRTGDATFANWMDKQCDGRCFRIVHGRDPVPSVPPQWYKYKHFGTLVWFPDETNWSLADAQPKRAYRRFSVPKVSHHSDYMGVHEKCMPELWWEGKILNMTAASMGNRRYIVRAEQDPALTAEVNAMQRIGMSWAGKMRSVFRKFKTEKDYFLHIKLNLSSVKELWAKLLSYSPRYAAVYARR